VDMEFSFSDARGVSKHRVTASTLTIS